MLTVDIILAIRFPKLTERTEESNAGILGCISDDMTLLCGLLLQCQRGTCWAQHGKNYFILEQYFLSLG